jgi:hypothetical protein
MCKSSMGPLSDTVTSCYFACLLARAAVACSLTTVNGYDLPRSEEYLW